MSKILSDEEVVEIVKSIDRIIEDLKELKYETETSSVQIKK